LKKLRLKFSMPKPNTYLGFPVGEPRSGERKSPRERGIAMIVVMFMITLMALFSADMIVSSAVDAQLASANRDNLKAEYVAKSGVNLATFLLMADLAIDLGTYELQQTMPTDGPSDFWGMLNGLQEAFDLSSIADTSVMDALKLFDGQFVMNITDESSKLNVNYLSGNAGTIYTTMLKAMMSCPAEKEFLEKKKMNVPELVAYIRDWADLDDRPSEDSAKSSEDDAYADREPKMKAKNAPFDTLDELRVIPGWDVEMHTIFSPFLTVYPIPVATTGAARTPMNFNTASREFLGCLFPKSTTECAEKAVDYVTKLEENGPATSMEQVQDKLKNAFCAENDEMAKKFTFRSDLYRVKVQAEVYGQNKTIELVLQRKLPDADDNKIQYKAAYRYLYWKML
jgi:type II secretory pathway component PulK